MTTTPLHKLEFELAYLALLTGEGIKPVSRWEQAFDSEAEAALQSVGLKTRVIERSVASGKRVRELLMSRAKECLGYYAARFDHTPVQRDPASIRMEGRLFGYPACCVESFVARGYTRNALRRADQRILFHWACPDCAITPLLLPHYRRLHRQCRKIVRRGGVRALPVRAAGDSAGRFRRSLALAASLVALGTWPAFATPGVVPPDPHWLALPTWEDPDADLLTSTEEVILGSDPACTDENQNGQPDGADLAQALSRALDALPSTPSSDHPYVEHFMAFGLENCQVCGAETNMGFMQITSPLENQSVTLPYIAKHFLEHGSFAYAGTVHSTNRVNPALLRLLLTGEGLGHFLAEPAGTDADNDGLRDWEEPAFHCDPAKPDTDGDQVMDGIDVARELRQQLEALPKFGRPEDGPRDRPFIVDHPMDGTEPCPRCGVAVVMDVWDVINPVTGMTHSIPSMALHYLQHGGCSWTGGRLFGGQGRVDPQHLQAVLTGQGDGHTLHVAPDADGDLLTDPEEMALRTDPGNPDEDSNQIRDGVDLARTIASQIAALPTGPVPDRVHRLDFELRGQERCDICGLNVNMGHLTVCNPPARLYAKVPYIALHYLEHGSFSFAGDVHGEGRGDVPLLVATLQATGPGHWVRIAGDADSDGLSDAEEHHFGLNEDHPDTNGDGVPDGFALAREMWRVIGALPCSPLTRGTYAIPHEANCFAPCPACGQQINCGHLEITNTRAQLSLNISYLNLHYLEHGSFAASSSERVDPLRLEAMLQPSVLIAAGDHQVALRWTGLAGVAYRVHSAPSLAGPWTPGPRFSGGGKELVFAEDQAPGVQSKFYKIVVSW